MKIAGHALHCSTNASQSAQAFFCVDAHDRLELRENFGDRVLLLELNSIASGPRIGAFY